MGVTAAPPADTCCQCSESDFVRVPKEEKVARRVLNGSPSVNTRYFTKIEYPEIVGAFISASPKTVDFVTQMNDVMLTAREKLRV